MNVNTIAYSTRAGRRRVLLGDLAATRVPMTSITQEQWYAGHSGKQVDEVLGLPLGRPLAAEAADQAARLLLEPLPETK